MPVRLFHGYYSEAQCKDNPDALFVFGDNFMRSGTGPKSGQAVIRNCSNAVGLATKHAPNRENASYFSDRDGTVFSAEIARFHKIITPHLRAGGIVYWPEDGIGTGLSEVPKRAPRLYAAMTKYSRGLFALQGDETYFSAIVCGGRDYIDEKTGFAGLDHVFAEQLSSDVKLEIIEGGAKGADKMASDWSVARGTRQTRVKADWDTYKKAAGFIRNTEMATRLQARVQQAGASACVVGLPGGVGTAMMLKISEENGFDTYRIDADPSFKPQKRIARTGISKPLVEDPQQSMEL